VRTAIIIPARYNSSRLPGKPLLEICGKTMIRRVYEQCLKASIPCYDIWVATDDERIAQECDAHRINYIMTPEHLNSGTDRVFYAADQLESNYDSIINVQGDEPLLSPVLIEKIIGKLESGHEIVSAYCLKYDGHSDCNRVKVVLDNSDNALYFSRGLIPYSTDFTKPYKKHIGVYGFSYQAMADIMKTRGGKLYQEENLEQLRWMEMGKKIHLIEMIGETTAIDTVEDYEKVKNIIEMNVSGHQS